MGIPSGITIFKGLKPTKTDENRRILKILKGGGLSILSRIMPPEEFPNTPLKQGYFHACAGIFSGP